MLLDALLGYHCFNGCDSISAFTGRGKIKLFVLMCKRLDHVKGFSKLGKYDELLKGMENFVCLMYGGGRESEGNVNELLQDLLSGKWKDWH